MCIMDFKLAIDWEYWFIHRYGSNEISNYSCVFSMSWSFNMDQSVFSRVTIIDVVFWIVPLNILKSISFEIAQYQQDRMEVPKI